MDEIATIPDLRRGDRVWITTLSGPRWLTVCEVRAETDHEWAEEVARLVFAEAPSRRFLPGSTFRRRSAR